MEKFADIKYVRPDFAKMKKDLNACNKAIKNAKNYEEFKKGFQKAEAVIIEQFTANTIVSIHYDMDTSNRFYEEEKKILNKKGAGLQLSLLALYKALANTPFRKEFDEEYGDFLTKKIEHTLKLMSVWILLDGIKENNLVSSYSKLTAGCNCDFRGEQCNFYGLLKHMESTDREERKEAFEKWAAMYESIADQLDTLYDKLVALRIKVSRKLGFKNYIDYIYLQRERYDYTAKDIESFRNAVVENIVPVCAKLYKQQAERIGLKELQFYDEKLFYPQGNPIPQGDMEQQVLKAQQMYHELSKETAEYFDFMVENRLFDLQSRMNKHMGGYCTFLPSYSAPFIFSNFNGTSADTEVLTHEAGHAFECYVASREQKTMLSISSTSEINEIHSMAMETFTYPWMELFYGDEADDYRYDHLSNALMTIPYLVAVDEFQHRIFEREKTTSKEKRQIWHEIEQKYLPWRHYDGNKFLEEGGFWMQKQHIFMYPFYYVDYALAQICAFQFYIRSLDDSKKAWDEYLALCKKGGSRGYFELLKSANLDSPFDAETIRKTIGEIEKQIDVLKNKAKK